MRDNMSNVSNAMIEDLKLIARVQKQIGNHWTNSVLEKIVKQLENDKENDMSITQHYRVDFEKVKTVEDIIRIFKVLDIRFTSPLVNDLDSIKDLLVLYGEDQPDSVEDDNIKKI